MKIHNIHLIFFDPKGFNMAYKMLIALLWGGGFVCIFCFVLRLCGVLLFGWLGVGFGLVVWFLIDPSKVLGRNLLS